MDPNKWFNADHTLVVFLAAVITAIVCYPIDVVRGLLMARRSNEAQAFIKRFGYFGFFTRGLSSELGVRIFQRVIKWVLQPLIHPMIFNGVPAGHTGTVFSNGFT